MFTAPTVFEVWLVQCDKEHCCLVVTTGGTGPAIRDVTPEATEAVSVKHVNRWVRKDMKQLCVEEGMLCAAGMFTNDAWLWGANASNQSQVCPHYWCHAPTAKFAHLFCTPSVVCSALG